MKGNKKIYKWLKWFFASKEGLIFQFFNMGIALLILSLLDPTLKKVLSRLNEIPQTMLFILIIMTVYDVIKFFIRNLPKVFKSYFKETKKLLR